MSHGAISKLGVFTISSLDKGMHSWWCTGKVSPWVDILQDLLGVNVFQSRQHFTFHSS